MNELLREAERRFPSGEYHYNEESNTVIVLCDRGKWVHELHYDSDGLIQSECLSEPVD